MKYKVGDRVYWDGMKCIVIHANKEVVKIHNADSGTWRVTKNEIKPIMRCKNV